MIKVNQDSCIGCGLCINLCPECFKFNSEAKAEVKDGCSATNLQSVIDSCPMQAISEE
ncbi:MAG TPA: ferredoxin [bacterium]|nr:ferredoxin [bacterium]